MSRTTPLMRAAIALLFGGSVGTVLAVLAAREAGLPLWWAIPVGICLVALPAWVICDPADAFKQFKRALEELKPSWHLPAIHAYPSAWRIISPRERLLAKISIFSMIQELGSFALLAASYALVGACMLWIGYKLDPNFHSPFVGFPLFLAALVALGMAGAGAFTTAFFVLWLAIDLVVRGFIYFAPRLRITPPGKWKSPLWRVSKERANGRKAWTIFLTSNPFAFAYRFVTGIPAGFRFAKDFVILFLRYTHSEIRVMVLSDLSLGVALATACVYFAGLYLGWALVLGGAFALAFGGINYYWVAPRLGTVPR